MRTWSWNLLDLLCCQTLHCYCSFLIGKALPLPLDLISNSKSLNLVRILHLLFSTAAGDSTSRAYSWGRVQSPKELSWRPPEASVELFLTLTRVSARCRAKLSRARLAHAFICAAVKLWISFKVQIRQTIGLHNC